MSRDPLTTSDDTDDDSVRRENILRKLKAEATALRCKSKEFSHVLGEKEPTVRKWLNKLGIPRVPAEIALRLGRTPAFLEGPIGDNNEFNIKQSDVDKCCTIARLAIEKDSQLEELWQHVPDVIKNTRYKTFNDLQPSDVFIDSLFLLFCLRIAAKHGEIMIRPARTEQRRDFEDALRNQLTRRGLPALRFNVVNTEGDRERLYQFAGRLVFDQIFGDNGAFYQTDKPFGCGVGSGATMRAVSKYFLQLVAYDDRALDALNNNRFLFWPMCATLGTRHAENDNPNGFLNTFLAEQGLTIGFETQYNPTRSINRKSLNSILDFIYCSASIEEDEHNALRQFLAQTKNQDPAIAEPRRKGEILLQPIGSTGVLVPSQRSRLPAVLAKVTDLTHVIRRSNKKKFLMICSPCAFCNMTKEAILFHALTNDSIRFFNEVVIDELTAERLIQLLTR